MFNQSWGYKRVHIFPKVRKFELVYYYYTTDTSSHPPTNISYEVTVIIAAERKNKFLKYLQVNQTILSSKSHKILKINRNKILLNDWL